MSDILIRGMEMPTNCCQCPVRMEACKRGYKYLLKHPELYDNRADDCPLVPVPKHGRLIDADALEDNNITYYAIPVLANVTDAAIREAELVIRLKDLDAAPTIIPADGNLYDSLKRGLEQAINGESRSETIPAEEGEG